MKSIKNYQSGSTHVLLISALVVALIGALGFIFWQNIIQTNNQPSTQDVSKNTVESKSSASPAPSKQDDSQFFGIDEWSVQFKLSSTLLSTKVIAKQRNETIYPSGERLQYYELTTERILSTDDTCYGVVYLLRYNKLPQQTGQGGGSETILNTNPINGFYYASSGPSTGPSCISHSDASEIRSSLKTIEAK